MENNNTNNIENLEKDRVFMKIFYDILEDSELDVLDAAIYGIIYSFNSNGKPCCYSQGHLAKILKIGRTSLNKRINRLVKKGWLSTEDYLPGGIVRYKIT